MRLDQLLVQKGLAKSRTQSQLVIAKGQVLINLGGLWQRVTKTSFKVEQDCEVRVLDEEAQRFVSRAGLKLQGALETAGWDVAEKLALDVGQSTGGFTDCLLQGGAKQVVGVDVGHGQLAQSLRENQRVVCIEGVNARHLQSTALQPYIDPPSFDLIVMDVSFISQTLILPKLPDLLTQKGRIVSLVKPQFEVGPSGIGKGGIVNDESLYVTIQNKLLAVTKSLGLNVVQYFESSITGGDGNREFFLCATKNRLPEYSCHLSR